MLNTPVRWLQQSARRFPDKVAVEDEHGTLTWAELDAAAAVVATAILQRSYGPNRPILVYLPKNRESVATFMAALYAGCPYAPLDYAVPMGRLQRTIENLEPATTYTVTVSNAVDARYLSTGQMITSTGVGNIATFTTVDPNAEDVISYGIWVSDTQITNQNANDVLGDGHVSYDAADWQLNIRMSSSLFSTQALNPMNSSTTKLLSSMHRTKVPTSLATWQLLCPRMEPLLLTMVCRTRLSSTSLPVM